MDILKEGFDSFFSFFSSVFSWAFLLILDFLYEFIFDDLFSYCVRYGKNILNFFFDNFTGVPTLNFLPFYVGLIFLFFILRSVIHILSR